MDKRKSVAVILPCYNEGERILPVIKEVKKSNVVSEIIIVDDGSDKQTKDVLKKISGVKIIYHPKNLGKSQAMKTGVLNVSSDIVVFVDCDLIGFKKKNLDNLIKPIIDGSFDLTISDRENELLIGRFFGISIILTGERAISRKLLLENIDIFDAGCYLVEANMNKKFFGKIRIGKVFFGGVGQFFKYKKFGIKGLIKDLDGLYKIIKLVGLREFISQLIYVKKMKKISY